MPRRFYSCSGISATAGLREYSLVLRFTTPCLKKFTGGCTWAAGWESGCAPLRGITCCIMRRTQSASTFFFRFLTGLRSGSNPGRESTATKPEDESGRAPSDIPRGEIRGAGILPAVLADYRKAKTPAGCRRHDPRALLGLVASGNRRQRFLIFWLRILG